MPSTVQLKLLSTNFQHPTRPTITSTTRREHMAERFLDCMEAIPSESECQCSLDAPVGLGCRWRRRRDGGGAKSAFAFIKFPSVVVVAKSYDKKKKRTHSACEWRRGDERWSGIQYFCKWVQVRSFVCRLPSSIPPYLDCPFLIFLLFDLSLFLSRRFFSRLCSSPLRVFPHSPAFTETRSNSSNRLPHPLS
jgi:hypothetical protein